MEDQSYMAYQMAATAVTIYLMMSLKSNCLLMI